MLCVIHVMAGKEEEAEMMFKKYPDDTVFSEVFVPKYVSMRRYHGVWCEVIRALFPGYLFIEAPEPKKVFERMRVLPAAMSMVHADIEILSVYSEEEEFLRSLMDEKYMVQMSVGFSIGEELCITKGALKNYHGKIQKIDRHKRIAVLAVTLFGKETPVEVGLEVVKKISRTEFFRWKEEEQRKTQKKKKNPSRNSGFLETVLIKEGLFAGLEGEVLSRQEGRIKVSITMLGQRMELELANDEVE